MQVVRTTFPAKRFALSTVASQTSCRRGWLRLVIQSVFATITVTSFILIVIMAVKNAKQDPGSMPPSPSRCNIVSCTVVCREVPYYEKYEEDIVLALADAESKCTQVVLDLFEPYFLNNELPNSWLSRVHSNVYQLAIIGGNLMHIPSGSFMSQFTGNIVTLILQKLNIVTWDSNSLVGLSSLRTLNIRNNTLEFIHENVLRAVDDTLETLSITECGRWDPNHFTGARGYGKLTTVDFSHNNFGDVLGPLSFIGLELTKILYLNSCKIVSIGAGAFDHLKNIEVLYLNNNLLVTVPPDLFKPLVALQNPRPRINLQDNFWYCDCTFNDLRELIREDLLLVEPECTYPSEMKSISFTDFESICNNDTDDGDIRFLYEIENSSTFTKPTNSKMHNASYAVFVDASYCGYRSSGNAVRIISPQTNSKCTSMKMNRINATVLFSRNSQENTINRNITNWPHLFSFWVMEDYSIIQIVPINKDLHKGSLVWSQSTCPNNLFCLEEIPSFLKVYSTSTVARYTFCLVDLDSANIDKDKCIDYEIPKLMMFETQEKDSTINFLWYLFITLSSISFGAVMVYALIRFKPTLLRGSKRILFVKYKNIEALVLPPKVPLRNDLNIDAINPKSKNIFTLSPDPSSKTGDLNRMKSVRSDKSGSPSYISAMQPTEDQLAEWRIRQHFNNDLTITSMKSELSTLSWIHADTNYNSLSESDMTYESLK